MGLFYDVLGSIATLSKCSFAMIVMLETVMMYPFGMYLYCESQND